MFFGFCTFIVGSLYNFVFAVHCGRSDFVVGWKWDKITMCENQIILNSLFNFISIFNRVEKCNGNDQWQWQKYIHKNRKSELLEILNYKFTTCHQNRPLYWHILTTFVNLNFSKVVWIVLVKISIVPNCLELPWLKVHVV